MTGRVWCEDCKWFDECDGVALCRQPDVCAEEGGRYGYVRRSSAVRCLTNRHGDCRYHVPKLARKSVLVQIKEFFSGEKK
jgi:hypothetical protein